MNTLIKSFTKEVAEQGFSKTEREFKKLYIDVRVNALCES